MNQFQQLLDVATRLLGPNGCPWDLEQTLLTLQPYLLEETHELIEAIDSKDPKKMQEELGDAIYTLIFIAMVAEKEGLFSLQGSLNDVREKLIRRHPHIFGEVQVDGSDDVMKNWEEIKMKEGRKKTFEGMPPTLPALARAQKVVARLRRKQVIAPREKTIATEAELAKRLWDVIEEAEFSGLDAESSLRRHCQAKEALF
jgi:MazG family protein